MRSRTATAVLVLVAQAQYSAATDYVIDVYRDAACTETNTAQPTVTMTYQNTGNTLGCFGFGGSLYKMGCNSNGNVDVKVVPACTDDVSNTGTNFVLDLPWSEAREFLTGQVCTKLPASETLHGKLRTAVSTDHFSECGARNAQTFTWTMAQYTDAACTTLKTGGTNQYIFKQQSHKVDEQCFIYGQGYFIYGQGSIKPVCIQDQVNLEQYSNAACSGTASTVGTVGWDDAFGFFTEKKCVRLSNYGWGKLDKCVPPGSYPICAMGATAPACNDISFVDGATSQGVSIALMAFIFLKCCFA